MLSQSTNIKQPNQLEDKQYIYYEANRNRYRGRILINYDDNGNPKYKNAFGKTEAEVKKKLKEIRRQILSGAFIQPKKKVSIISICTEINDEDFELGLLGESTYYRRLETVKLLGSLAKKDIATVTLDDLNSFFRKKTNYSNSVISKLCQLLARIFKEAKRRKLIEINPMDEFKRPCSRKKTQKIRAMTLEEQNHFILALKKSNTMHKEQMFISMLTGMRMGEVNALEVRDVDFNRNVIRIRRTVTKDKNGKTTIGENTKTDAGHRTIQMMPDVAKILRESIGDKKEGLIFRTTKNRVVCTDTVSTIFRNLIHEYNVIDPMLDGKLTLHSLRHTFATRCIESGMPAKVLQKILGHTDITVTMNTYCDAFENFTSEHFDAAQEYMYSKGIHC